MAGSNGEATTGMPPVVPKDSRERAPSGRGFTDDTDDDSAVGLEGMPVLRSRGSTKGHWESPSRNRHFGVGWGWKLGWRDFGLGWGR